MRQTIRPLMFFEAATFAVASLIHAGALVSGYAPHHTRIAAGVIALVPLTAVPVIVKRA